MSLTCVDISKMKRHEWLAFRRGFIGGSDAPVINGKSKFTQPFELAHDKLGMKSASIENDAMRNGTRLEPVIFKHIPEDYLRLHNKVVEVIKDKRMFIDGWRSANIDGRVIIDRQEGLLEIKTADRSALTEWKKGIPEWYEDQGYHYMDVLKSPFMLWCCWCGVTPIFHIQYADFTRQAELYEKERLFHQNVMIDKIIPEPTFKDFDFAKSFQGIDDNIIYLDSIETELESLLRVKADKKDIEQKEKALQAIIRAKVGNKKYGESENFTVSNGKQFLVKRRKRS